MAEASNGAITGLISPLESSPAVYAIAADTLGTAFVDQVNGKFLLRGLPAGAYKVTFQPKAGYQTDGERGCGSKHWKCHKPWNGQHSSINTK